MFENAAKKGQKNQNWASSCISIGNISVCEHGSNGLQVRCIFGVHVGPGDSGAVAPSKLCINFLAHVSGPILRHIELLAQCGQELILLLQHMHCQSNNSFLPDQHFSSSFATHSMSLCNVLMLAVPKKGHICPFSLSGNSRLICFTRPMQALGCRGVNGQS